MLTGKQKKWLGGILILIGIMFISPIVDFSDGLGFFLFSAWKGVDLNASNFSVYFLDYTIFTFILGAILIFFGLGLLGKNFSYLKKKLDLGHFNIALMIAVLAVLAVGLLDAWSATSGVFGSLFDYTRGDFGVGWWPLFFKFALVIFSIPAISYYFLVKQDKSEAFGIFFFSAILYFGGMADLAYFIFQKMPVPETLPWLIGSPLIKFISIDLLGYSTVTNVSLVVSVVVSFVIAWFVARMLKDKF